ncbi:hypothetical protein HWD31_gp34 [Pantoea phage vB_PagM_SSEM1]|uniref:Uncharacterized protein n=1 Tax=Pantoea phage vB_PagM_SSEM1 TaxID=2721760 RepID=A0A6H0D8J2_9CAUD|nr:hypothetical protein HWD31_gp34 [Pantoea phage vB_PagM_SSEM1]QIS79384.1 hypothetical protein SSEM1_gp34 [Pantoea phage vB_PagM_SSEM1]
MRWPITTSLDSWVENTARKILLICFEIALCYHTLF